MTTLKAPFPYFGGKSKIAPLVWERFGKPDNYVEPFFGSGAVLLGCPYPGHTETVNDLDALLCNFWRALQADPEAVARYADWPVNETDLHARHRWLVARKPEIRALLDADPEAFDAKAAGWWVWGASAWIGSGWCVGVGSSQIPHLGDAGPGLHRPSQQMPHLGGAYAAGQGVHSPSLSRKIPSIGNAGRGVHRAQLPDLRGDSGATGHGIHATAFERKTGGIYAYFDALAARLRRVRVCCGDWQRVLGPSVTWRHGTTAIFLDPPYAQNERADVYAHESEVFEDVRAWAIEHGTNPLLRIAVCGYDFEMPEDWSAVKWKTSGGYGSQGEGRGRKNAAREVVWFSPHCVNETPMERLLRETT